MTKKKVEVNDDILKNIIVGDIPVFGRAQPMNGIRNNPDRNPYPSKIRDRLQLRNRLRYSLRKRPL